MRLKSIKLENIRSYRVERIEFPQGSVLLAGDIGSGKSTILLAIEFALFGIKSGELSGGALLRHGCKQGSVELIFKISDKEVIVKRTLKRIKDRIGQSSGYIVIDDVKHDLMPKELRARIFELLNYPASLVSKGQDLIYRFTVYTPQEQMKRIIYENKDSRLDTLRKVFNIDKYKRIRENVLIYIKSLKEKRSNFEGRIVDLEDKKKQREDIKEKVNDLTIKEKKADEVLNKAKKNTNLKKQKLVQLESRIKEISDTKKETALLDLELRNILEKREKDKKEIDVLQKIILRLREELKDYKEEPQLKIIFEDKERRIETLEKELIKIRSDGSEIKGKVNHLKQQSEKVKEMDNCPLCLQEVPHTHKEKIISKSNENITELKEMFVKLEKEENEMNSNLKFFKRELREMTERISLNKALRVKKEGLIEKEERLHLLRQDIDEAKKKIGAINSKKIELKKKVEDFADLDKEYSEVKKEHETALNEERKFELELNSVSKEIEGLKKQLRLVEEEITEKEKVKRELKRIISLQNWLEDKFINLVANMEKHVMLAVYHEFNELFQQWFSMLIEDENLNVRLDDSFSVIVEQNGYETFIENLSGGEKTSVALAYRLALNRVINDVVSEIRTKDLLILDEPTEGFSTTQLDRVRDVLDQLNIKQIIIVSHEGKIESFVDNVVRISKQEGVSEVSS